MKFLSWLLGVMVCCLGLQLSFAVHDRWSWFWFPMLGVYALAGCGLLLYGLYRAAMAARKGQLTGLQSFPPKVKEKVE
jgi:hypothetical protein